MHHKTHHKTHQSSSTVEPAATVALLLGTPEPAPSAASPPAAGAARSARHDLHSEAEAFRKDMHHRSEAPFKPTWHHGGINE